MKKIKVLLAAFVLASMTVVSCSSDDSSGPAATIEGKWNQGKTIVKIEGESFTDVYDENTDGCDKNYVEFVSSGVYNDVVYFKQAGECQESIAEPGTWVKVDDELTINNGGELTGTYSISKLTNSDLQITFSDSQGGISTITTVFFKKVK